MNVFSSSSLESGIIFSASLTIRLENGRRSKIVATLNIVWIVAIPSVDIGVSSAGISKIAVITQKRTSHTVAPIILIEICAT